MEKEIVVEILTFIYQENLNRTQNLTQQDIQTPSQFVSEEIVREPDIDFRKLVDKLEQAETRKNETRRNGKFKITICK